MSDKVHGFTIILDDYYHEDQAEKIKNAINMIKGVLEVKKIIACPQDYIAQERVKKELMRSFHEMILEALK